MFILHPTSLAFPLFNLSAGCTLAGPLAASLDDGSSASTFKVTLKSFFGYTLDRREALRYLSSLPHALMSPVLMKACYGDIIIYRSQPKVYLKTVWAALKMAVGETLTQEQVNVLLPGIPAAVFSVAQDDVCPAITRRLSIILFTGVGVITMIILACLSLQALLKKVLDNISASTPGSAALDPLPSSALPNPPLEDEHRPSPPVSPASGKDVVAVISTGSNPESDDEAFVYPDPSKGSPSSTSTEPLAASFKDDEHHSSLPTSGGDTVIVNSPGSHAESEEEVFTYIDRNQPNETTSTVEESSVFQGSSALPKSSAVQDSVVEEATAVQSSNTVGRSSAAIRSETMTEDIAQSSTVERTTQSEPTPDGSPINQTMAMTENANDIFQADLSIEGTVAQSQPNGPSGVSVLGLARSEPTVEELSTVRDGQIEGTVSGSELIASHIDQSMPAPTSSSSKFTLDDPIGDDLNSALDCQTTPVQVSSPISPETRFEPDDDEVLLESIKEMAADRMALGRNRFHATQRRKGKRK